MKKILVSLLLVVVVVIIAIVVSIRFFPKLYVSAFNELSSEEQASIEKLDISFFPLAVKARGVNLINGKGATLVSAEGVSFSAQFTDWYQGKLNFWKANLEDVDVQIHQFATSSDNSDLEGGSSSVLNIHELLSGLNLDLKAVHIQLNETSYVQVNHLITEVNDASLTDYELLEQRVDYSLNYFSEDLVDKSISVNGVLGSKFEDGVSKISVSIPEFDLVGLLEQGAGDANQTQLDTETQQKNEEVIDWQWMSLFEPVELNVVVRQLSLSEKSSLKDFDLLIKLDDSIAFTYKSKIAWFDSEEFSFENDVTLSGKLTPTSSLSQGADLQGDISFQTNGLMLDVNGLFNVNGSDENDVSISLGATEVPIKNTSLDEEAQALIEQYFPVAIDVGVKQVAGDINANIISASVGESDLKGDVLFTALESGSSSVKVALTSDLISYRSPEVDGEAKIKGGELNDEREIGKQASTKVFNDDVIDWSWIEGLDVDFSLKAKEVHVDDIVVQKMVLPVVISEGKLSLDNFTGDFAGGAFDIKSNLVKQEEKGDLFLNIEVDDIVLEKLGLLPPEELQKGITNAKIELTSKGNTTRELSSSLNGLVSINVGDGVLGNDSFELVGSDFILGLLNKLNPFSKSDKTTNLECVVVNLQVQDGKINIDKSIALRTSKLTMVADGYVDLNSEKIKLGLTPKARSGVGVDVSSLVKFISLGGTLKKPTPTVTASGLLKSAVVVGAAVSTGGVSLLATSVAEKTLANVDVCKRASNAY